MAAALAVLEREPGVPLTLAAVASELGVATMSLYTHVRNREELLTAVRAAALAKFKKSPLAYAKKLTDPVTHERFATSAASPHVVRDGRDYWFQSTATRARFEARPDSFATRQGA